MYVCTYDYMYIYIYGIYHFKHYVQLPHQFHPFPPSIKQLSYKKTSGFKRFRNNYNQQINIELSTKMDDHMDDHMDLYVFHEFSPLRLPT